MRNRKLIAALLSLIIIIGMLPTNFVFAENESEMIESDENFNPDDWIDDSIMHRSNNISLMSATKVTNRYTVLALDVSGSMGSAEMSKMKEASIAYCDKILASRGNNYVAVVKFGSSASLACGFTNDIDTLKSSINSLYADGGTDTAGGLRKSKEVYDNLGAANVTERNIILISDGEPNSASEAQGVAQPMWNEYNIYTIGYNLGSSAASFMQSIQNCGYYNVSSSQDIQDAVTAIAGQILSGASGNINNFLGNETTITVYENTKSPYSMVNDFKLSENAVVTVNGQTYTTGADGNVKIPTITSGSLTISKKGYVTKTVSAAAINISGKVYLERDEGDNPIINAVLVNNVNILYDEYGMDLTSKEEIMLTADVTWKKGSFQSLYLVQDAKRESFVNNKLTLVMKDKFDISEEIYIVAIDTLGNTTKKKLQITLLENVPKAVEGFKFSMGDNMSFTLPESTGFLAGSKVGVGISSSITDLLPVEVAVEDNKVYISIGVDIVNYTKSDKYATNSTTKNRAHVLKNETKTCASKVKDIYKDITSHSGDLFDTSDITKGARKLKYFKETYNNAIKYPKGSFGVDADFTVLGFGEGYIDSDGKFQWIDGGIILCPSASVSWSGQFAIGPVPAYWEASISASIEAKMNLYMNAATKQFTPNGDISGTLSASIGAGAGVKKVLSLGGGITGTLSPLFRIYTNQPNYFRLDAKLNGYFKVTVVGFEYKYDTKKLKLEGTWIEEPQSAKLMGEEAFEVYDSDYYELIDRSYAEKTSQFLANNIELMSENLTDTEKLIKTNIYTYSAPQITAFEDGSELIVWLDDVKSRTDINRTALYYTYCKNGVYSTPQIIEDDGTADFYPDLYVVNNTAYLAWNDAKTVLADSDDMSTVLKNLEISVAKFDTSSGAFQDISAVTNNSIMDIKPVLFGDSDIYCAWMSNEANSIDAYSGYNILFSKFESNEWSSPQTYIQNLNSIDSIDGTVVNGSPQISYCIDMDGDINTTEDIKLIFDGNFIENSQGMKTNVVVSENMLYWYEAGTIQSMDINSGTITQVSPANETINYDNFKVFSGLNGSKAIVFAEYNGLYSELYGYIFDAAANSWSEKVKFTNLKQNIDGFDGYIDSKDELVFIVNENEVIGDYENNNLYGDTNLVRLSSGNYTDLEILNIDYDEDYVVEGNNIDIAVVVKNNGRKNENFVLELYDKNNNMLSYCEEQCIIAGQTITVELTVTIDENFDGKNLKALLSADEFSCEDTFNLQHEDLSIENMKYSKTNDGKVIISADLVNRGYGNGNNVEVALRENSVDGNVISTEKVSVSELLDSENVSFEVDDKEGKIYFITIDSDDSSVSNNSDYVILKNDNYSVENGQVTILLAEDTSSAEITVPTKIGDNDVVKIGDSAYDSCQNAKTIILPDGITEIGNMAFANCTSLEKINIPKNVTQIGSDVLKNCNSLTQITVDGDNANYKSLDGVLFEINADGTLTLIKCPAKKAGDYVIPDNVTDIAAYAFEDCQMLESVTIPSLNDECNSEYAFKNCTELKTVEFSGTIRNIPNGMFINCSKLENINIPEGTKTIEANAFANCYGIKEVCISDSVENVEKGAFAGCNSLENITLPFAGGSKTSNLFLGYIFGASSYGENASYVPESLRKVVLTNKDATVESNAFYNCNKITQIEVNNETINNNAFRGCSSLANILLSYKVITITSPFSGCPATMEISGYADTAAQRYAETTSYKFNLIDGDIPHEVYKSGMCGYDFEWDIYYDHIMELTGEGAMPDYSNSGNYGWNAYSSYIDEAVVCEGVTSIGTYAFAGDNTLKSVKLPNSLKSIKNYAFDGDSILNNISIPSNVLSIGAYAFRNCTGLDTIIIGESVQSIGSYCFANNQLLSEISLPDSVTEISDYAFNNCIALGNVYLSNNIASIGEYAFGNCTSLESIKIPYTAVQISPNSFSGHIAALKIMGYKNSYAETYAGNNNIEFEAIDGDIPDSERVSGMIGNDIDWSLSYDGTLTINGIGAMPSYSRASDYSWYTYRSDVKNVYISGVTSIGNYAFDGFNNLKKITMSSDIKRLGSYVFRNCNALNNVSLSGSLEYIGAYDFQNCTELKEIYIPDSVKEIKNNAFYNCNKLTGILLNENLTTIADQAFGNCTAILNIEIPYTTININANAFYNHLAEMSISGYKDSYAQAYAEDNDITFIPINGTLPDEVRTSGKIGDDITWELTYDGTLRISGVGAMPSYSNASSYGFYAYSSIIKSVIIGEEISTIGNNAFNGYNRLRNISLPDGLISIGSYAFSNCRLIKDLDIPDSVTTISSNAFYKCSELSTVSMSSRIETLESGAFAECVMLNEMILPYTVVSIASDTFREHSSTFVLKGYSGTYSEVYAKSQNIPFESLNNDVPDVERSSGKFGADFNWTLSYNGTLTITGTGAMPSYSNASSYGWYSYRQYITKVSVEGDVTSIGNHAFNGYSNLSQIVLSDKVRQIGDYSFANCPQLTGIRFSANINIIGSYAFSNCNRLASVELPDGLSEINGYAFNNCTSIQRIYIPYTVVKLYTTTFENRIAAMIIRGYHSTYAEDFANSNNITFEAIDADVPDGVYVSGTAGNNFKWSLTYGGVLTVSGKGTMPSYTNNSGAPWYGYSNYIRYIVLEEGVTGIGNYAFSSLPKLKTVKLPKTLKTIGSYAFRNDTALEEVQFENGVDTVNSYAFAGCSMLKAINIPDTVTRILSYAFLGCNRLENISLSNSLSSIGDYCFSDCTELKEIIIPPSVSTISTNAFNNHILAFKILGYNLTYAQDYADKQNIIFEALDDDVPEGIYMSGKFDDFEWSINYTGELRVKGIGTLPDNSSGYWNSYSSHIKSIVIESGITAIGSNTFNGLTRVKSLTLADTVKSIGNNAFEGNTSLSDIALGAVEAIGAYAFRNCSSIENIDFPNELKTIGGYAFSGCNKIKALEIPVGTTTISERAFENCLDLDYVIIPYTVTSISNQVFYNHVNSFVMKGYDHSYAQDYAVSNAIEFEVLYPASDEIMDEGVIDNDFSWKLTYSGELIIDGLGAMPDKSSYAWQKYSNLIKKLTVNNGVTGLGSYVCRDCTNLTNAVLNENIKTIGSYAFYNCKSLKSINLPNALVNISTYAFEGCEKLKSIQASNKIKTINNNAFYKCYNLSNVYFDGSSKEWQSITIGTNNTVLTSANITYNTDTLDYIFDRYYQTKNSVSASVYKLNGHKDDVIVLGVYEGSMLVSIAMADLSNDESLITLTLPFKDGQIAKCIVWNSNMKPYMNIETHEYTEALGEYADITLETPHNYNNNMREWYVYSYNGDAQSLDVKFSQDTMTESLDYIYIYDINDNLIGQYNGTTLAGQTVHIPGNTVKIYFTTDGSVVYYGFKTDSIYVTY